MQTRQAKTHDLDQIMIIGQSQIKDCWTKSQFQAEIDKNSIFLVAEEDGELVGYIILMQTGEDYELLQIAVKEDKKRKKVATNMFEKAKIELQKHDCKSIFLEVRKDNFPAIKFYEKNNFVKINERKDYYGKGQDAIIMEMK